MGLADFLRADPIPRRLAEYSSAWALYRDSIRGHGVLAGFDLSLTCLARLRGLDLSCKGTAELEQQSRVLCDLLSTLPVGAMMRVYSCELAPYAPELDAYIRQFDPGSFAHLLAKAKGEQCRSVVAPRKREVLLALSTAPIFPAFSFSSGALGRREREMVSRARSLAGEQTRALRGLRESCETQLGAAGIGIDFLDDTNLFANLWRLANPMRGAYFATPRRRKGASLRQQLFLSGLLQNQDYFEREGQFLRVVSMHVLPEAVEPGCIRNLQSFDFPTIVCTSIRRLDSGKAVAKLETTRSRSYELRHLMSKVRGREKAAELPEHRLVAQQEEANEMLALLTRGDALCELSIQCLLVAPDREVLDTLAAASD